MQRQRRPAAVTVAGDPERVTERDLGRLEEISSLLTAFNDPRAGADLLARHVQRIPPLQARVEQQFRQRYPGRRVPSPAHQVALLGNRVLEAILLGILEDIVVLHSELATVPPT